MSNSKKIFSFKIACLSIILLAVLIAAPLALAQSGTRLYFQPLESAADTLAVEVMAENVTDLYGLELHLKYDPAVLELQDGLADQQGAQIEPGSLLPVTQGFVVANQVNPAEGTVVYALTLLNPAPAVSGSGPVARISFKTLQATPSTLTIEQATLVSVNLETIPVEMTPLTIGGAEPIVNSAAEDTASSSASATESGSFPWWIVAAVILGLGVLTLGGLVALGGFNKKVQPQTADHPAPTQRGSGMRPSAFRDPTLPKPPQSRQ